MNRKSFVLSGALLLGGASAVICAPLVSKAQSSPAVNSQQEFDKVFGAQTDANILNTVGHAFDNQHARLFWFTDLEAAKRQAKAEGKPILSLRLLGKLSDEYSCANSRFFRVLLYANTQINPILRDKFILHWSSERPVPVMTIDFGDGRKIKQTMTGNSAHYLLDETGRPLDVLPGLYSPQDFQKWLVNSEDLANDWKNSAAETREANLKQWHKKRISNLWSQTLGAGKNEKWVQQQTESTLKDSPLLASKVKVVEVTIPADRPARLAFTKGAGERPLLSATTLFASSRRNDGWAWGGQTETPIKLDDETKARIKAMNPRLSASKTAELQNNAPRIQQIQSTTAPRKTTSFDAMIQNLENSVTVDTAANKFGMEIPIHALFAHGQEGDFTSLNRKIYDTLFLTPKSDPYLGLASDNVFTGLQNGGIVE
ncbi:hypothetical protein EON80_10295 [bacterium]|nr:MAG: hypothetical protein EON80_10295 [bacterium]